MRTIEEKLYKVGELSEEAKAKAYEKWFGNDNYGWEAENEASLKKFCEIFPVTAPRWQYDVCSYFVDSVFQVGSLAERYCYFEDYEEMSGWRLATFLWNNYGHHIYKGKYYGKLVNTYKDGTVIEKSKEHPACMRHVLRYSKVIKDTCCVLTGFGADEALMQPIYKFMKAPDDTKFPDLLNDCLQSWGKYCHEDIESSTSMQAFEEHAEINDYEFYEDGKRY